METKKFGIFVGLYNRTTGQKLTVKNALKNNEIVALYDSVATLLNNTTIVPMNQVSTQKRSYDQLDLTKMRREVYDYIKQNPSQTRREIANGMDRFLNSVTGRVTELIGMGLIYACGEKHDFESDRDVETLKVVA